MAVLAKSELTRRIFGKDVGVADRLFITPLLDPDEQIGTASIDVRLGNEFIVTRRTNLAAVNPSHTTQGDDWSTFGASDEAKHGLSEYQERIRIDFGQQLVLHPRHFVLACTLEYIALPGNLTAEVIGRSSWGRVGLIIATATAVSPGFKGSITLELVNEGEAPLILVPGVRIAQLVFAETTSTTEYKGRYGCPTGPQFSRLHRDKHAAFWSSPERFRP